MKKVVTWIFLIYTFLNLAADTSADILVAEESASLKVYNQIESIDTRVIRLEKYLNQFNSPLAKEAETFVKSSDKYQIDWRLVPAITGVESTFGKNIPNNSFNAFGWANGKYSFKTWEESIDIVSYALKEKYIDKGANTVDEIGRIYAPPSPTWSRKVKYFMEKIDSFPVEFTI